MVLPQYSIGVGDRFSQQGSAQLDAILLAYQQGVEIAPVWNKSYREHSIVGSRPADVREEADRAVRAGGWTGAYFVDADHIGLKTVEGFLEASDFFTLDVADWIGVEAEAERMDSFAARHQTLIGRLALPGIEHPVEVSEEAVTGVARKFLAAVSEAGRIYRRIVAAKGEQAVVIEVSFDETDRPQTPTELLLILAMAAEEGIPLQTIAPRFVGRFNKGVDYVGDVAEFGRRFEEHLAVVALAVKEFGLPTNLKLSVHSGSDKFAIYRPIHKALQKFQTGLHLKTAGTTWLEELIGLAVSGDCGLKIAKEVYRGAWQRFDELCVPYASVIDIDRGRLPLPENVAHWTGDAFAAALRHDPTCAAYSPHLRQLLHVGYKVAAEMGNRYVAALGEYRDIIARNVTENLFARHIGPVFLGL
jgi:hypothetical protein